MEGETDKPFISATSPQQTFDSSRFAEAEKEKKKDGLGGGHMLMIGAALIGSGALMIGVLSARGTGDSAASTASRPAPAASRSAMAVEPSADAPRWVENTDTWTPKTRRRVAFEVQAVKDTQVWMKTVRPLLVVRCVQGEIEGFVYTDSAVTMEAENDDHTVRMWFDAGDQQTERWPDSSAHDALFAPNGPVFVAQLMQAKTFRFGYHPHNAAPVVAQFNVAGLREKLDASPACKARR